MTITVSWRCEVESPGCYPSEQSMEQAKEKAMQSMLRSIAEYGMTKDDFRIIEGPSSFKAEPVTDKAISA